MPPRGTVEFELTVDGRTFKLRYAPPADDDTPSPPALRVVSADECTAAIVALLEQAGRRLTTAKVIAAVEEKFGEATVKRRLAAAVRAGLIDNRSDAKPPGYGLTAWAENS